MKTNLLAAWKATSLRKRISRVSTAGALILLIWILIQIYTTIRDQQGEYVISGWSNSWAFAHNVNYCMYDPAHVGGRVADMRVVNMEDWRIGPWWANVWHRKDPRLKFFIELNPSTKRIDLPVSACRDEESDRLERIYKGNK